MSRPKEFNENIVIARAMELFWANGFEGTSLDVLEEGTGLNRSSIYSSFGGKLELFCKALDAYSAGPCIDLARPFKDSRGGHAIHGYLENLRVFVQSKDARKGCLMVNTSIETLGDVAISERVNTHFQALRSYFYDAYSQGIQDRSVNMNLSPGEVADWLITFVRGLLVGAGTGESTDALDRSISTALKQLGLGID